MLDFRLYTFLVLSQTLNYTKAAQHLCITQPAVTQHIKYLENQYQHSLFAHHGKDLELTRHGRILQKSVEGMYADEQHTMELLKMKDGHDDSLRFGATLTIGEFYLPPYLCEYQKRHPATHIRMHVANTSALIQMLKKGDILFAFIEGYFKKRDVEHRLLCKARFVAVKHKQYQLKKVNPQLEDLLDETLILRESGSGTREILERILQERNLSVEDFRDTVEIGNINAIKYMLQHEVGISFLYEAAVHEELLSGSLEIIAIHDFDIERDFSFITRKDSIYLHQCMQLYEELQNFFK